MYGFPHCYTKSLHPHSSNSVQKHVQLPLTNGKPYMYGFPHCYTKSLHPHSSNSVQKHVQLPLTNGKPYMYGFPHCCEVEGVGRRPEGDWRWARRTVPPAMRSSFPHFLSFPFLSFPFLSLPFLPFLLSSSPLLSPYLFVPLLFSLFTASHANSVRNPSPPSLPLCSTLHSLLAYAILTPSSFSAPSAP